MIDLFGLPLTSILLFVLAGVLVGHLLWYPDRARQKETVDGLENRYWRARTTARARKSRYRELERISESQTSEIDRLKAEYDGLLSEHRDAEHHLATSRRELATLRKASQQSDELLAAETRRSESLVQQLQEVLEASTESEQEQQRQLLSITDLKQEVESLQQQLSRTQSECEVHTESVTHQQQLIEQLEAGKESVTEQVRSEFQSQLDEKSEALERTERDLVDRCADLDRIRGERDTLAEQVEQAKTNATHLESELRRLEEINRQRDEMASDLQSAADSLGQQRELLEAREVDLNLANEELSHLRHELKTATELLDQNAETQRGLLATVDARDAAILSFEGQVVELETQIELLNQQATNLESRSEQLDTAKRQIEDLNNELRSKQQRIDERQAESETLQQKLNETREVHEQTVTSLHESNRQLEDAQQEAVQLRHSVETLQTESYDLRMQLQTMGDLESKLQSLAQEHESGQALLIQVEAELSKKNGFIDQQNYNLEKLTKELDQIAPLQEQIEVTTSKLIEQEKRCQALSEACTNQQQTIEQLREEASLVPELREDLQQTIAKLEFSREETSGAISRVDELRRQLEGVRVQFSELQTTESVVRRELHEKSEQLQTVTSRQQQLHQSHEALINRCAFLENQSEQFEALRETESTLRREFDAQTKELQSITVDRQELQQSRDELATRCELLEQENVHYEALMKAELSLRAELASTEEQLQKALQESEQISQSHQQLAERCDQLAPFQSRFKELQAVEASLQADLERQRIELGTTIQVRDQLEAALEEQTMRVRDLEASAKATASERDDERRAAREIIDKQKTELESLKARFENQTQSLGDLNRELADRRGHHETATREVTQLKQRLEQEVGRQHSLEKSNVELQGRVANLTEHLQRLRGELEDSLQANEQAHEQIRDLRRRRAA